MTGTPVDDLVADLDPAEVPPMVKAIAEAYHELAKLVSAEIGDARLAEVAIWKLCESRNCVFQGMRRARKRRN